MSVTTLTNFAELLRFKKANALALVVFGALADPKTTDFLGAVNQLSRITAAAAEASQGGTSGVTQQCAFGAIDVDDTEENICEPFKVRAMPTTIIFRDARESARVEGLSVEELRQSMAAHMPPPTTTTTTTVTKKTTSSSSSSSAASREEEFRVVNAFFGNLNTGDVVDVTDRVREVLRTKRFVTAEKGELGVAPGSTSSETTNMLRVVIDRFGTGKTFTLEEGKQLHTSQCSFCFAGHGDVEPDDAYEDDDAAFGADNKIAQLPQIEKGPRSCGG